MQDIQAALKANIRGDVHFDPMYKKIYSVDASIYEVEPLCIVIPKDKYDVIKTLEIASQYDISVTARGAATGITGGCLGTGIILDLSTHLNRILEINIKEEYAICEPGVVQDRLNEALSSYGYRLGPDTSTGNRATIGGMLGNNAAGARSLHYGRMVDHVDSVELALASGKIISCGPLDPSQWNGKLNQQDDEGHIYREVNRIRDQYGEEIRNRFPTIPRRVSGYNLDQLLTKGPINLSKLVTGSEGTLGIATEIKMKISRTLSYTGLCILHVDDMISAMGLIDQMLAFHPVALEMIDNKILKVGRSAPSVKDKLEWIVGDPQAVFVAEFAGETAGEVKRKLEDFSSAMKGLRLGYAHSLLMDPVAMNHVWEVRKAGLGLLLSKRSYNRAIAFIEDLSVAPEKLGDFIKEFCDYLKNNGKEAGIYGHIGSGCMHIRPYMDLRKPEELNKMVGMMSDVSDMILKYSGALSGEHGDGLIRSWLNEKMFGKELYKAFVELKTAFDPRHQMNPGKIVHGPEVTENLRLNPEVETVKISTFLDFSQEGGFELAADLCNGNGQCRKAEKIMCPSFQATGNEYDTTRARAQSLRAIIHGRLPISELTGDGIYDVMDLCLECKGCKTECPSQVDMAKMKSELLYQYQEKHGYFFRNYLFGYIDTINKVSSPLASLFNKISKSYFGKKVLKSLGITPHRHLPELASERFSSWFKKQRQNPSAKKVVLFNDTYTEYNAPEIGKAAFKILQGLGYQILLITGQCCGRPLISKGLLRQAKAKAFHLVNELAPFALLNYPIISLEPSCHFAIKDDYKGLLGSQSEISTILERIIGVIKTLDEFLCEHLQEGILPLPFDPSTATVLVHVHCHQKALIGTEACLQALKGVPGFDVKVIETGCCGVAGSFGYEEEHYELSMKIGDLHLLPTVRNAKEKTMIVANGISCRSQVEHGAGRKALHIAEAIANRII